MYACLQKQVTYLASLVNTTKVLIYTYSTQVYLSSLWLVHYVYIYIYA